MNFSNYFKRPLHFLSEKGAWSSALILLGAGSLVCLHGGHHDLLPPVVPAQVAGAYSLGTNGAGGNIGRVAITVPCWCGFVWGM